uniref:Uncharacterized protein n=1 Tax=Panagrellus redivivus TaxID=6233 RepID=A0A7E4VFU5_PANRE
MYAVPPASLLPAIAKTGITGSSIMVGVKCSNCVILVAVKPPISQGVQFSTASDSHRSILSSARNVSHVDKKVLMQAEFRSPQELADKISFHYKTRTPPTAIMASIIDSRENLSLSLAFSACDIAVLRKQQDTFERVWYSTSMTRNILDGAVSQRLRMTPQKIEQLGGFAVPKASQVDIHAQHLTSILSRTAARRPQRNRLPIASVNKTRIHLL